MYENGGSVLDFGGEMKSIMWVEKFVYVENATGRKRPCQTIIVSKENRKLLNQDFDLFLLTINYNIKNMMACLVHFYFC